MDWRESLGDLLGRYENAGAARVPDSVDDDFDRMAGAAPRNELADGVTAAFRSDDTPPFAQMLGGLFGRSPANQRSRIVGSLLTTLGPMVLSQILARRGAAKEADAVRQGRMSDEVAERIPPEAVQEAAEHAEKQDPSIVERIGHAYAEQPELVKTLGKAALAVAMAHMVKKQWATR